MLTTEQVAALLAERGVTVKQRGQERPPSARTIEQWCRKGKLPCVAMGEGKRKTWLIDRADLDAWSPPKMGRGPSQPKTLFDLAQRIGLLEEEE